MGSFLFRALAAAFIFATALNAQSFDVKDTVIATTMKDFQIPDEGVIAIANLARFNVTAELLDANGSKIRDLEDITRQPTAEEFDKQTQGGRLGATVWFYFTANVVEPGEYYVKFDLSLQGEAGDRANPTVYYYIMVYDPQIASPVEIKNSFFFGEKHSFSFATLEYPDWDAYSYEISANSGTIQGQGPVVALDEVLSQQGNVGGTITVKGYYNGQQIYYYPEAQSAETEPAEWTFTVKLPPLQYFGGWADEEQVDQSTDWYLYPGNQMSNSLFFAYLGLTPDKKFVTITPKAMSPNVTSEPADFVGDVRTSTAGVFMLITVTPSQAFMDAMEVGDDEYVRLTVQFRDQFGNQIKKYFRASVIK